MDVGTDHSFLVVDLENCVSADIRNLHKSNIYTNSLSPGSCHEVTELTAVQNITGDINESISRVQHPFTQFQTLHYPSLQVNYDGTSTHSLSPLYQCSTIQSYSTPDYSTAYLQSLSPIGPSSITVSCASSPPLIPPPTPPPLPPLPKEKKKQSPPDPSDVPRFPINDYEYYKEIEQLLTMEKYPGDSSDNYKRHLRKRAHHYLVVDDILYHSKKNPKKVVMRKMEQMNLLDSTHVTPDTGVHLGIKKMVDLINGKYFWRGLYEDVANYVNKCPKCRDSVDLAQRKEKEFRRLGEEISEDEIENAFVTTAVQTLSTVWSRVEIQMHGPFKITESQNEYVLTITDPESCFVNATPLTRLSCAKKITDFILKTFYTFGFSQPYFIGHSELYEEVVKDYDNRLKQTAWKTKLNWVDSSQCSWVSQLAELLIVRKSDRWDKEMDKFMFQFRAGFIRDSPSPKDCVPFYSMFQRFPYHDDRENFDLRTRGRNHLQCDECDDVFISKVALRLHKTKHSLEEARKTSLLEYAIEKNETQNGGEIKKSVVKDAMGEIKSYLEKTKDSRRKRGKYQKYPVELQEHMIEYAKKNGIQKASKYFTQHMTSNVSESTIRNLLKSSVHFAPRTKQEIAHYAIEFGIEEASKYFTITLNKNVPPTLVCKFKMLYGGKFAKKSKKICNKNEQSKSEKNINNLTNQEKESIGEFACEHTIQETINVYYEKFNVKLDEINIKELQKIYLEKQQSMNYVEITTGSVNLGNFSFQTLPAGSVCFSPSGSIVQIQDVPYTYEEVEYHAPIPQDLDSRQLNSCGINQQQLEEGANDSRAVDNFLLVSDENIESCNKTSSSKHKDLNNSQHWNVQSYQPVTEVSQPEPKLVSSVDENEMEFVAETSELTNNPSKVILPDPKPKKNLKKKEIGKKRGSYTTYSPELRAKIGKYAAEHGSQKASNHFSKILGHDLPESTARGLKERYLKKVRHCDVTSLGYSTRGRPLRLGKYDEVVQECLKELVTSGERVTSFLAITTAKKLLNQLEPSLLQENGGTVVLNNTWAKSILKRIGVRNNS